MKLGPLRFAPWLRPQVWGGRALGERWGKSLPNQATYGESWEISDQSVHLSRVIDGPAEGKTLADLVRDQAEELYGNHRPSGEFPLLVKLLDCKEPLSVQVHPTDALAQKLLGEPRGKTEAWVVLEVEPTGRIFAGLVPGTTPEEFERRMLDGTVDRCLASFQPTPGDCLFVPAGTVHAVGGGVVMAEVQQTSDATFRLFDWNRLGTDGKPRELHLEKGLASINFQFGPRRPQEPLPLRNLAGAATGERLVDCSYFVLDRYRLSGRLPNPFPGKMSIWIIVENEAELFGPEILRTYRRGETVMIPACDADECFWQPASSARPTTLLAAALPG
jgi:mannose-6-phosphate isomerase